MAKVYNSICSEIDTLTIKIIQLSEKHIQLKLEIEQIVDHGLGNLAKARYIMGSKCVTSVQLPTAESIPFSALATITYNNTDTKHPKFTLNRKTAMKPDSNDSGTGTQKGCEGLRKRKDVLVVKDGDFKEKQEEMSVASSEDIGEDSAYADPMRMFGVLVPTTLKLAQQSFVKVLDLIVDSATIQSELQTTLDRYEHLLEVKKMVEDATMNKDVNIHENFERLVLSSDCSSTTM